MPSVSLWPSSTSDDPLAEVWRAAKSAALYGPQGQGEPAPEHWEVWLESLFPQHVRWGFAPHHRDFWEWASAITAESTPDPFVGVWSRGGAKSSSAELAVAFTGVTGRRRYWIYLRETQEMADKSVGNIAALLESDAIARHYPQHAEKSVNKFGSSRGWRRNRLITAGGFVVDALGLDAAARGVKFEEQRPDGIALDDIDGKHDTPQTTAKKIDTITTSILPAGAPNLAVLAIQNLIIPDGVFTRMVDGRADYLARRIVSGPHPALRDMEWEYEEQADGSRRAIITAGKPTWEGQNLAICQHQVDTWGIGSFLKEAQHQVQDRSDALALNYDVRHNEGLTDEEARTLVGMGQAFGGIDFGAWRFAFNLWAADRSGRVHQIAEYFSQQDDLEHRARVIHCLCTYYGVVAHSEDPPQGQDVVSRVRVWGDSANQTDIAELNAAFRRIGSPLRVIAVGRDGKMRSASVERINDNLSRNTLLFRVNAAQHSRDAVRVQWKALKYKGEAPDLSRWQLGLSASGEGVEMTGSRLLWEMLHWVYPVPKPGLTQAQDPDDHTADGADQIAAMRYALMSWWKAARPEPVREVPKRNEDRGLERLLDRLQQEQDRHNGAGKGIGRGDGSLLVRGNGNGFTRNGKR